MDRKNILSVGIIGTLLYNILPTGVTRFLTKNDPELKAIEKKIQQSKDEADEAYQKVNYLICLVYSNFSKKIKVNH